MNIEKMVRRWEQFENDLASHKTWISEMTKRTWNKKHEFNNLEEIIEQRNACQRNCSDIKFYEKHMEDFMTCANNLEEISGSVNVKTSKLQTQNEFTNIKDGNLKDLEEIEAILIVLEHYERTLAESKEWLDSFDQRTDESEDINKCVQDELGGDFRLDDDTYPPILVQATSEGKKASDVVTEAYISTNDINDLYEHWSQILSKIQGIQETDKARIKVQNFETKLIHYKNSLQEIIEEISNDDGIDWLYPTSIDTAISNLRSAISKLKKENKELIGIYSSIKESNITIVEGGDSVQSKFEEILKKYEDHERSLTQQIDEAEQTLSKIKEYHKKKDELTENLRMAQEKINKVMFPMDPQDWNINVFNNQARSIEKLSGQFLFKEKIDELSNFCQDISRLPEKERAVINAALNELEESSSSINQDLEERKSRIQNSVGYLKNYNSHHDEVTDWLHNQEEILSSFHYQSNLDKKMEQKEAFTTVLQTCENWKQTSLNRYIDFVREMTSYFEKQRPVVEPLMDREIKDEEDGDDQVVTPWNEKSKQVTNRFDLVEQKLRCTLDQCNEAINAHVEFNNILKRCEDALDEYNGANDDEVGSTEDISTSKTNIEFIFRELIIQGKEVANTTSPSGFAEIQQNISSLQQKKNMIIHADDKKADINTTENENESEEFDFSFWLEEKENLLNFKEVQPQTSLEEKSRLLKALKQEVAELANSADALKALEGHPDNQEVMRYKNLIHESKQIIKKHEEVISTQEKIGSIMTDLRGLLDDIENFLEMIGNGSIDSTDSIIESSNKLQSVDFHKITQNLENLKKLSVIIIPVAAEHEKQIITSDISIIEDRISAVQTSFGAKQEQMEETLERLNRYKSQLDAFTNWMDNIIEEMESCKLKAGLEKKMANVKQLKSIQSEIVAKELELSDIEQSCEDLNLQNEEGKLSKIRSTYQDMTETNRTLTDKLQNEIDALDAISAKVKEMQDFISTQKGKLEMTLKVTETNYSEMQAKREAVDTIIKSKEEGNGLVIEIVKMQESVLSTIPQDEQVTMRGKVKSLHNEWHQFISLLTERRLVFDNQINDWKEITEEGTKINVQLDEVEKMLKDINTSNTTLSKLREEVDMLRHIREKLKCAKLDIDTIQSNVVAGCPTGKNHPDWPLVLSRYESLLSLSQDELNIRENTMHNYREYKNHVSELEQFLQRCKDKVQTVEQRSPNDKNYANAIIQALSNLLNKEAQGQIIIEHVEQATAVLISKTPSYEVEIRKRTEDLKADFNNLFEGVSKQNKRLNIIMKYFGEFKDESERLTDWTKQININIKAIKTSLPSSLSDKKKSLDDMRDLCTRLEKGKDQIKRYVDLADKMKDSPLESNVLTQKKEIVSKFQQANNVAIEVLERVQTMYDYHQEFQIQVETARKWMESAWEKIRQNSSSAGKSREDLQYQLSQIQGEIDNQNQGLGFVQAAIDNAEKAMKNTRSDGKDAIQQSIKELNADWEKLTRKMATAKVGVETDLLQWSDEQQSVSRLEEWIKDRETRLNAAVEHKNVMITRRSTLGITTLSVSERSKSLGQTNMILQDIQAFEPLVQTFTASAGSAQDSPLMDIAKKYRDLSKHAQEVFDHEKEMIRKHESFMVAGNDFMQWLKVAKEKLEKCSEPVDEKDYLSEKLTHLKILEAEIDEGKGKLDYALQVAVDACSVALDDDR